MTRGYNGCRHRYLGFRSGFLLEAYRSRRKPAHLIMNGKHLHLPDDVTIQLLLKLPALTLLRFKAVSTRWFELISDPMFVKTHLSYLLENPTREVLILSLKTYKYLEPLHQFKHLSLTSNDNDQHLNIRQFQFYFDNHRNSDEKHYLLEATCNGLLLVQSISDDKDELYVYNPVTGHSLELSFPLPASVPRVLSQKKICFSTSGTPRIISSYYWSLVYDSSSGIYKVMAVHKSDNRNFVLKLNPQFNGEWNEVTPPISGRAVGYQCLLVNNELHWLTKCSASEKLYILAFDVFKEQFTKIECPTVLIKQGYFLLEVKGSLYIAEMIYFDKWNMWILQDKSKSVWSLTSSITLASLQNRHDNFNFQSQQFPFSDFTVGNNMKVFINFQSDGRQLFSFNSETQKCRCEFDDDRTTIFSSFAHVNSLVSLNEEWTEQLISRIKEREKTEKLTSPIKKQEIIEGEERHESSSEERREKMGTPIKKKERQGGRLKKVFSCYCDFFSCLARSTTS